MESLDSHMAIAAWNLWHGTRRSALSQSPQVDTKQLCGFRLALDMSRALLQRVVIFEQRLCPQRCSKNAPVRHTCGGFRLWELSRVFKRNAIFHLPMRCSLQSRHAEAEKRRAANLVSVNSLRRDGTVKRAPTLVLPFCVSVRRFAWC